MRIAVITTSYPADPEDPSGHFVHAEARALIEAGHEVVVYAPSVPRRDFGDGPRVVELPHWGLFGWPGALARLRKRPWALLGVLPFVTLARRELTRANCFDRDVALRSTDVPRCKLMRANRNTEDPHRNLARANRGTEDPRRNTVCTAPFDQVIAHWLIPSFWPISRDYVSSTHVVCHGSDVRLVEALPRALQRRVIASLCRPNVHVRCVSSELAKRLHALVRAQGGGALLNPIVVEPAALALPVLPSRAELRRQLGLASTPLIVIVGRLVASKRIDVALDVIQAAVVAASPRLRPKVVVIGDGPDRIALQRQHPEATWLGRLGRRETLTFLGAADLLVTASLQEGAPTVVREARALGTRVVAAPAGDLLAWSREDPGLLVTPFEPPPHPDTDTAIELVRSCLNAACLS